MSYQFGSQLRLTIFGESHQPAIGVVIDGLPAGMCYPQKRITKQLARRAPGQHGTTQRKESDYPTILCGLKEDRLTGSALTAIFANQDTRATDYPLRYRPSHSDFPADVRYHGFQDWRGGGQFSGRLTLPLVFAGAFAQELLEAAGIAVAAHLIAVGKRTFARYDPMAPAMTTDIPPEVYEDLSHLNGDSIGASIECAITGVPVGVGEPFFDSVESCLAHLLFSVPGIKGVLFGDALKMVQAKGSEMNDCYDENIHPMTNHNGGILGGLTTGMPIIFECCMKPTPSIALAQNTYDRQTRRVSPMSIHGRHDPCIALRALPVIEASAAIVILDLLWERYGKEISLKEAIYG